jgi:GMP synthase (glutamine-hydrolysing)
MRDPLRFLVIDGNPWRGRRDHCAYGGTPAGALYARALRACEPECRTDVVEVCEPGARLPWGADFAAYDGVCWTGSSLNVYDATPEVRLQIELARAVFESRTPQFGSCWAAQIAVTAAGGGVRRNPRGREIGIARKIALNAAGRAHPMYEGKADVFDACCTHVDEIDVLPQGATVLAANAMAPVQAVAVRHAGGAFWAPQYHPEFDLFELARLIPSRSEALVAEGFFADSAAVGDYAARLDALHQDPSRTDLRYALAIDGDVLDEANRLVELRNWILRLVVPSLRR